MDKKYRVAVKVRQRVRACSIPYALQCLCHRDLSHGLEYGVHVAMATASIRLCLFKCHGSLRNYRSTWQRARTALMFSRLVALAGLLGVHACTYVIRVWTLPRHCLSLPMFYNGPLNIVSIAGMQGAGGRRGGCGAAHCPEEPLRDAWRAEQVEPTGGNWVLAPATVHAKLPMAWMWVSAVW